MERSIQRLDVGGVLSFNRLAHGTYAAADEEETP
jgi:hypothetical protein